MNISEIVISCMTILLDAESNLAISTEFKGCHQMEANVDYNNFNY